MQPKSLVIGVFTMDVGGYYYGAMLSGIHQVCHAAGVPVLVMQGDLRDFQLPSFGTDHVAGWIVIHPGEEDASNLATLVASRVPVVTVPTAPEGIAYSSVVVDNRGETRALVNHLIDHGHRQIAYINHEPDRWNCERYQGYLDALHERGITFDPALVIDTAFIHIQVSPAVHLECRGEYAAHTLIAQGMPCTALVASTDQTAIAAMQVLQAAGYRVPEDVAVVGFDDIAEAQYAQPPLTTVRTRFDLFGRIAAEHLVAVLRGERDRQPTHITAPARVLHRRSCGCAGVEEIQSQGAAAVAAASNWQSTLAEGLVAIISYPLVPHPGTASDQIWPGVSTLVASVDAVLQGHDSARFATEIEAAWQHAVAITENQDVLDAALSLLEDAAEQRLTPAATYSRPMLTAFFRHLRQAMLRAWLAHESRKNQILTTLSRTNQYLSLALLASAVGESRALAWLRHTSTTWGCLALWDTAPSDTAAVLTVAGVYQPEYAPGIAPGNQYPAVAFPPFDALALSARQGHDLTIVFPLRAGVDDLGVLVLSGFTDQDFVVTHTQRLQAALLTAALKRDNQALELAHARDAAEAANRAKSAFLSNMSHELRTPLNGILGYTQILKRKHLDDDTVHGLDIIAQSGEHLLTLINDILDLAKIEAGRLELNPTTVSLPTFLHGIVAIIRARAEAKQLHVDFEAPPTLPAWVQADETRLRQVLLNLLGNAVKFTDQGHITLRVDVLDPHKLETGAAQVTLRVSVQDTGIGIAVEHLARIFQPFEQASTSDRRAEGTGLGLPISQRIVHLMGSRLQVTSALGQGSTFWFDLTVPLIAPVEARQPTPRRTIIGYRGARRRVLVVDDQPDNRRLLREMLEPLGFIVATAADGQQGLEQALALRPDAVVLDLVMPGLSGIEVAQAIREYPALRETCIVAASASVQEANREQSRLAGYNVFLPKPIKLDSLLEVLEHQLQLIWIYATAEPQTRDRSAADTLIPPPQHDLQALYELANSGRIFEIRDRIAGLAQIDPAYRPFTDTVDQLTRRFASSEIRSFVAQFMRGEHHGPS